MTGPTQREDPRVKALGRHRLGHFYDTRLADVGLESVDWESAANIASMDAADLAAGFVRVDTNDPATIERVAAAMWHHDHNEGYHEDGWYYWSAADPLHRQPYIESARAVLAALRPSDKDET